MRPTHCIACGTPITQPKTSKKLYCDVCARKRKVDSVMRSKKKRVPTTEIGVGSGNSSKNKNQPLGIQTYRRAKKDKCEWCGATKNLVVHHLDENRYNNTLTNLITICKSCHQKHHTIRDPKTGRYIKRGEVKSED